MGKKQLRLLNYNHRLVLKKKESWFREWNQEMWSTSPGLDWTLIQPLMMFGQLHFRAIMGQMNAVCLLFFPLLNRGVYCYYPMSVS